MDIATVVTTVGSLVATIWLLKGSLEKRFDKIDDELKNIRQELGHTNERISRIEGYIEGRDISQKRKTGTGS